MTWLHYYTYRVTGYRIDSAVQVSPRCDHCPRKDYALSLVGSELRPRSTALGLVDCESSRSIFRKKRKNTARKTFW